jgi:hypothetical protein
MRIRLGILSVMLMSALACNGQFQEVQVLDWNGEAIRVLRDPSELQILAQHWSQREEKEKPTDIIWTFHVNIRQGKHWTTWLYHPDGWMQVLTKQRVPTYKMSEPETVNRLLGIHNNRGRSEERDARLSGAFGRQR